jgi:hypothetical protein
MTTTSTNRRTEHRSPFAATRPVERRETYARLAEQARVHRFTRRWALVRPR